MVLIRKLAMHEAYSMERRRAKTSSGRELSASGGVFH
jgi:hypothetical protein